MKSLFLIILFSAIAHAGGPRFEFNDPTLSQEFDNVYHDIRSPTIGVGTASTMTITNLIGSTGSEPVGTGNLGEYLESQASQPGSTSVATVSTVTLSAGHWLVLGGVSYNGAAGATNLKAAISLTSASFTGCIDGYSSNWAGLSSADGVGSASVFRYIRTSSTIPVYLVATISASRTIYGGISAIRMP